MNDFIGKTHIFDVKAEMLEISIENWEVEKFISSCSWDFCKKKQSHTRVIYQAVTFFCSSFFNVISSVQCGHLHLLIRNYQWLNILDLKKLNFLHENKGKKSFAYFLLHAHQSVTIEMNRKSGLKRLKLYSFNRSMCFECS